MSTFFVESTVSAAIEIVVKASMLLGIAAFVQLVLLRRASAATRHLVWTLAVACSCSQPSSRLRPVGP
jgi:hypothetical protein